MNKQKFKRKAVALIDNLTEREKEVLELIKNDALIKRDEIAAKLKISESAVGTYIHHLSTKGYLLGKGYITAPEKKIVVVGGANLDIKGYSPNYISGTSSPGWIEESLGGVGRNIAENLALLDQDVLLLSVVGDDHFGRKLQMETEAAGVDLSQLKITAAPDNKTGIYLAHLDDNGELLGAVNDMRILKEIDQCYLTKKRKIIENAALLIFDTNLDQTAIDFLFELTFAQNMIKIADTVSLEKSLKLKNRLDQLDYLRANLVEIEVLLAIKTLSEADYPDPLTITERVTRIFNIYQQQNDLPAMIVSAGNQGAYYFNREQDRAVSKHFPAEVVKKTDIGETTGAGDALTAAFAAGLNEGLAVESAIKLGIKAAAITIKSKQTCSPELANLELGCQ
ncbi:PfkB family carbohydrate kinase [Halanaerobium salsuginis]|uniref:Pseudouridine kinase n=1 Tax=Halanaerobium salsuginis TaxID=29563 RepID=A0A1I4GUZ3_9FIRM|nr:PfkB family carbohydrate kinase [Halanaerobium salsuginis]SFL33340.1 pseudouridine kinase [Halanaerobium salsuginis]